MVKNKLPSLSLPSYLHPFKTQVPHVTMRMHSYSIVCAVLFASGGVAVHA